MKHLKALLAAFRVTTTNTTNAISGSIEETLGMLRDRTQGEGFLSEVDADRVSKILAAVVADMRDEDARNAKAAQKAAQKAAEVSGPPRA